MIDKRIVVILCLLMTCGIASAQFEIEEGDRIACADDTLLLEATTGASYTDYKWYIEGVNVVLSTDTYFAPEEGQVFEGQNDYVVTADDNGTLVGDTVTILYVINPEVDPGNQLYVCEGDSVLLKDLNSADGNFTYKWSTGETTDSIYADSTASYGVEKTVEPFGCSAKDSVEVTVTPLPELDAMPDITVCPGQGVKLSASVAQEGTAPYSYTWSPEALVDDPSAAEPEAEVSADTTLMVVLSDASPATCRDTAWVNVLTFSQPSVILPFADTTLCKGDTLEVTASVQNGTAPYTFQWSPNEYIENTSQQTTKIAPLEDTEYQLLLTDDNGCEDSTNAAFVISNIQATLLPGGDTSKCPQDTLGVTATVNGGVNPYSFVWELPDGGTRTSPTLSAVDSGTYVLTITDEVGCEKDTTYDVMFNGIEAPFFIAATSPENMTPEEDDSLSVEVGGTSPQVEWFVNGDGSLSETTGLQSVYTSSVMDNEVSIQVEASNKCGRADTILVFDVVDDDNVLFIPNTIVLSSGNEDENRFRVYGKNIAPESFLFRVMNRQGRVLYETGSLEEAMQEGWDGTGPGGDEMNSGAYVYTIKGEFKDGVPISKSGTVTVVH